MLATRSTKILTSDQERHYRRQMARIDAETADILAAAKRYRMTRGAASPGAAMAAAMLAKAEDAGAITGSQAAAAWEKLGPAMGRLDSKDVAELVGIVLAPWYRARACR